MLVRERDTKIELYDVNGRVWNLNDPTSQVRIVRGGMPTLEAKLIPHKVAGRVQPGSGIPQSQQATMRVGFYPGPEDLGTLKRRFRAGWAHDRECTLRVSGGTMTPLEAHLRLPDDGAIASPQVLSPRQVFEVMEVPMWWEDGVWWSKRFIAATKDLPKKKINIKDQLVNNTAYGFDLTNYGCVPLKIGVKSHANGVAIEWPSGMVLQADTNLVGAAMREIEEPYIGRETEIYPYTLWLDRKKGLSIVDVQGRPMLKMQRAWWSSASLGIEYVMPGETMRIWAATIFGVVVWTGVKSPWD